MTDSMVSEACTIQGMRPLKEIRVVANSSAHEHTDWWKHKRRVKSLCKTASCNHPPKAMVKRKTIAGNSSRTSLYMRKETFTAPTCSATLRLSVKIHAKNSE